jgi:hypothetical protein
MTPSLFVYSDAFIQKCAAAWVAVPIVFIIFKALRIQFISLQLSDKIVDYVAVGWPALRRHYEAIEHLASVTDATNYILFYVVIFSMIFSSVIYLLWKFIRFQGALSPPGKYEAYILALGVVFAFDMFLFDTVQVRPVSYGFYVDSMGMYYVRQMIEPSILWAAIAIVLVSMLRLLSSLKKALRTR